MKKVAFDIDGTLLDIPEVQEYAKELISKGIEVHIVTTRWDKRSKFCGKSYYEYFGNSPYREVIELALKLGIKLKNVHFCNYQYKFTFFNNNKDFIWHLDDNEKERRGVRGCGVEFVNVCYDNWKTICDNKLFSSFA